MNSTDTAQVLIFRGVNKLYSYRVPETLKASCDIGSYVMVPFGRTLVEGLVIQFNPAVTSLKLKPIRSLNKNRLRVHTHMITFIVWFTTYYQCTPYKAFQTIIGNKKKRPLPPDPSNGTLPITPYPLTDEQKQVLSQIKKKWGTFQNFYLKGVTGSGKTEIYLQLATQCILEKKQALILVPEIALTPQLTRQIHARFGAVISVIHSHLTPKEREIEYNRIHHGQARVVIGPRSAIFAPLDSLGLIVIDEEHEQTYKQENHPRYDARTLAQWRAKACQACLVFGSATPSIDTYARCLDESAFPSNLSARFSPLKSVSLRNRVHKQALPEVEVVDMRRALKDGFHPIISSRLDELILDRLAKKEKIIILVNRRGFSTYILCNKCKHIQSCLHCGLSYTYHADQSFRCHRCHVSKKGSYRCSECFSEKLSFTGLGIQKVESELKQLYPKARLFRLDKDTAQSVIDVDKIIQNFKEDGDILIGTQMIAKGHHIDTVTLVGVLGIDTVLNLPDFRAPEKAFQLLTQVSGRAGRGLKQGHVVIQTFQAEHYAIEHAKTHHFSGFMEEEMRYRQALSYPPFRSLINIILSCEQTEPIEDYCVLLEQFLYRALEDLKEFVSIIGPTPAPIERIRNHFRWHCLVKCDHDRLDQFKSRLVDLPKSPTQLRVILDFDPMHIL